MRKSVSFKHYFISLKFILMQKILCFLSEYCLRILMVPQDQSEKTAVLKLQTKPWHDGENIILPTTKESLYQTICFLISQHLRSGDFENTTEYQPSLDHFSERVA